MPTANVDPRRLAILVSSDDGDETRFAVHGQPFLVPYAGPRPTTAFRLGGLFSVLVGRDPAGQAVVVDAYPTEDGHPHGGI